MNPRTLDVVTFMPCQFVYHSKDGTLILPMATFNRRMARRLCDQLGIWEDLKAKGIVDADPYVKENDQHRLCNLGLPMNFSWQVGMVKDRRKHRIRSMMTSHRVDFVSTVWFCSSQK